MTLVAEALRESAARLERSGASGARLDAELLLGHVLGVPRSDLYARPERALDAAELERLAALVDRRAAREPLAYIVGGRPFRRLRLDVDPRVLVPRPETELLVERALQLLAAADGPAVLDVGTGSGAVALAIADEHPGARVTACDASPAALAAAAANAARLGLELELVESDLYRALAGRRFRLVVSNPPYIAGAEIEGLEPEVRSYEPRLALDGGPDGGDVLRRVVDGAPAHLDPGGALAVECGSGQAGWVAQRLRDGGFVAVAVDRDLAGHERIVSGRIA